MELLHLPDGHILIPAEQYVRDMIEKWSTDLEHPIAISDARETKHVPLHKRRDLRNVSCQSTVDEPWYHRSVGQVTQLAMILPDLGRSFASRHPISMKVHVIFFFI